jgi:hypothetical protein
MANERVGLSVADADGVRHWAPFTEVGSTYYRDNCKVEFLRGSTILWVSCARFLRRPWQQEWGALSEAYQDVTCLVCLAVGRY